MTAQAWVSHPGSRADRGLALSVLSIALMSLAPVLTKIAVGSLPPLVASTTSYVLICAVLVVLAAARGRAGTILRLAVAPRVMAFGVVSALGSFLLYQGIAWSDPIIGGLLIQLSVPFGVVLAVLLLGERMGRRQAGAIGLVLCGLALFLLGQPRGGVAGGAALGIVAVVLSALAFAYGSVLSKPLSVRHGTLPMMTSSSVVTAAVLALGSVATHDVGASLSAAHPSSLAALVASALLASLVGKFLFYKAIEVGTVTTASVVRSLGPILVALYSLPLGLAELSLLQALGGLVLCGGLVLFAVAPVRAPASGPLADPERVGGRRTGGPPAGGPA